jgi:hypothetical protein
VLRRVDAEEPRPQHAPLAPGAAALERVVPAVEEADAGGALLPRDHPKWVRDAVTISQRARELAARLRPVVMRVFTFWDHRVRSAFVAGKRVGVDASGSYRAE